MKNIRVDNLYFYAKENNDLSLESCFYEIPMYAYLFALEVKKSRLENEDVFLNNMSFAVQYSKNVIKGRLPEKIESKVFFNCHVVSYYYGQKVEKSLVELDPYFYILEYHHVIKTLPDYLHNFMLLGCLKDNVHAKKYVIDI